MDEKGREISELTKMANLQDDCSGREHARDALKGKIIRLERQLSALRTLEKAINWKLLDAEQEQDLWTYFVQR